MNDDELNYWGERGRKLTMADEALGSVGLSEDVFQIWKILGAIIEKMGVVND